MPSPPPSTPPDSIVLMLTVTNVNVATTANQTGLRQAIADAAGVGISDVSIDFEEIPATVRRRMVAQSGTVIRFTINVPGSMTDAEVEASLAVSMGSADEASVILSASATANLQIVVAAVPELAVGSGPARFVNDENTWTVSWHVPDYAGGYDYAEGQVFGSFADAEAKFDEVSEAYAVHMYKPKASWAGCLLGNYECLPVDGDLEPGKTANGLGDDWAGWELVRQWAKNRYQNRIGEECEVHCGGVDSSGPCDWCYSGNGCCMLNGLNSHARCPTDQEAHNTHKCVELLPAIEPLTSPSPGSGQWMVAYFDPEVTPVVVQGFTFATYSLAMYKFDTMNGGSYPTVLYTPGLQIDSQWPMDGVGAWSTNVKAVALAWATNPTLHPPAPPYSSPPYSSPADDVMSTGPCEVISDADNPNRHCIIPYSGWTEDSDEMSPSECVISGLPSLPLIVEVFEVLAAMDGECNDYFAVNDLKYCGTTGPVNVCPAAGQDVYWTPTFTDNLATTGWKVWPALTPAHAQVQSQIPAQPQAPAQTPQPPNPPVTPIPRSKVERPLVPPGVLGLRLHTVPR